MRNRMRARLALRGTALLMLAIGLLLGPVGALTASAASTTKSPAPTGPAPHAVSPSVTGVACTPGMSCVISSSGGTLDKIVVGADTTVQVVYPSLSATDGQVYPPEAGISDNCTADNGVWVLIGTTLYGPNFDNTTIHCDGSATGSVTPNTFFTPVSQTESGSGTSSSPFQVTTVVSFSGVTLTQVITYVPGDKFYRQTVTLAGNTSPARIYHGADIYLYGSDNGFGYRDASSGAVGGQNCVNGQPGGFYELLIPGTAAQHYVEAGYSSVWSDINSGKSGTSLPDSIISNSCIDNGAALEWDNVSAGTSVLDAMSFNLGQAIIPPSQNGTPTTTNVGCNPNPVASGSTTTCTVSVTSGSGTPTGSVSFSTSGSGHFSTGSCTLSSGSCAVTFTPTAGGSQTITASYGANGSFLASGGNTTLNVTGGPAPVPDFPTPLSGVLASLGAAGVYGWLRLRTSRLGRRRPE